MLKGVIFSLKDVLATSGELGNLIGETIKLIKFLKKRNVTPVFVSNHSWTVTTAGKARGFQDGCKTS